jgi:cation:H+ antiporter
VEVLLQLGIFVVSLAALLKGSDWFIDSAEEVGLSFGISPFIIGLTIVAFGTSLPELATSISSVIQGESTIVIGSVVGSNITNIALVLGLVAISIKQIDLEYNIWHIDMPYLWGSAFLLYFTLQDQVFSLPEAFLFLVALGIFLMYSFKNEGEEKKEELEKVGLKTYGLLILGGFMVAIGADFTIKAISNLSMKAGISPETIALTVVAFGTSLPEIIVSIGAAKKGKTSIAVGNVLGSNVFNTYCVMAFSRFFGDLVIPSGILTFSLPIMIVMTLLFGIVSSNKKITQWEGMMLILFYVYYVMDLVNKSI